MGLLDSSVGGTHCFFVGIHNELRDGWCMVHEGLLALIARLWYAALFWHSLHTYYRCV